MAELTGQQILEAAGAVHTELVDVSKWVPDGQVRIRVMSAAQHDAFEKSMVKVTVNGNTVKQDPDLDNQTAKLLVQCICDEEGRPLFNAKQIVDLGRGSKEMLRHIFKAAVKLNGLNESIEDIAKNLTASPESDSSTD